MNFKGFVFTVDSLFSLASLSLLALVYVLLSSSHLEIQKYAALENQGRDYLVLNYIEGEAINPVQFHELTGHRIHVQIPPKNITFDFSPEEFSGRNGTWDIFSKLYRLNFTYINPPPTFYQAIAPSLDFTNYFVQVQIMFSSQAGNDANGGLGIRANSTGARYVCMINGNNKIILWKVPEWNTSTNFPASPPGIVLATGNPSAAINPNLWYTVWMDVNGETITCGAKDASGTDLLLPPLVGADPELDSGFPVLEATNVGGITFFDNFSIVTLPPVLTNSSILLRSVLYDYPHICDCSISFCSTLTDNNNPCLLNQEILNDTKKEVWVS